MDRPTIVRQIGARLCRFTNGQPCLCVEKKCQLCKNVGDVAWELYSLAVGSAPQEASYDLQPTRQSAQTRKSRAR